jgi:phosphoribosylformylglycinamidine synthase
MEMKKVNVLIIRAAGTNCDVETSFAFKLAGANCEQIHINLIKKKKNILNNYHIIAIPGGFTYGDDIASGRILANELKYCLKEEISQFIKQGRLIIGICNGFQVLVKSGLLPCIDESTEQQATLTHNDSGMFEDRWTFLKTQNSNLKIQNCIWTKDLSDIISLPVAHGEGKFIPLNWAILKKLKNNNQIVFQYCNEHGKPEGYPYNPNGSVNNIAGICNPTGRILGLMPHPERYVFPYNHPSWQRMKKIPKYGDGFKIFKNAVEYAQKYLL